MARRLRMTTSCTRAFALTGKRGAIMKRKTGQGSPARRWLVIVLLGGAVLWAAGWLVFVPRAQEPNYQFVLAWGGQGDRPGQFDDPTGIAVADGEVFVSDARNDRVQVFDFDGRFKRQFGTPGRALGELGRPMNLTVYKGELYIAEYWNDRIQVFGLDGTPKRSIGKSGTGAGEFRAPGGVAVASNGDLFVADFYNHRVQQLRPNGSFVRQWGTTGERGIGPGAFGYPTDTALGPGDVLYVADGYNDRIQAFGPDGNFLRKWGGPFAVNLFGPFNGWFTTVTSVATDRDGNVFVADFYNHRVQTFSSDGTFRMAFGEEGSGPGQFKHAIGVAVADDSTVFAADLGNHRIQKWQPR
jgi:DNA-binding beta-propeller fold protein YncE